MIGYFVLHADGEGGISIRGPLTWPELQKRITPYNDEGDTDYGNVSHICFANDLSKLDRDFSTPSMLFVIRGEIVVPKATPPAYCSNSWPTRSGVPRTDVTFMIVPGPPEPFEMLAVGRGITEVPDGEGAVGNGVQSSYRWHATRLRAGS